MVGRERRFEPYTAIKITISEANSDLLHDILSTNIELPTPKISKPVMLYGAGNLGKMAKDFFDFFKIPILEVIDIYADKHRVDEFWKDAKITDPSDISKQDKENLLVVCIVNSPFVPLRDKLTKEGWKNVVHFYDVSQAYNNSHPLNNGWVLKKPQKEDKTRIEKIFLSLADDLSRAHYLQFLAWRKLRLELHTTDATLNTANRFFIPQVASVLHKHEVFVDCGAYNGAVVIKFLKLVGNKYRQIYAIEPDPKNFDILKKNVTSLPKIKTIKAALSKKSSRENFYSGFNLASRLDPAGNSKVKTFTLDKLNIPATYIKMHLEGGELEALMGSEKTIKKFRPILAVTIYHNELGVSKIPWYQMKIAKDYDFYMRLHSWCGTGAVLYAIPKERENNHD